jgi:beta-lactamase regulating signal transducer with metallopeptidase domain
MNELLHSIVPWADAWSENLWRASWQGSLAIGATWAIARGCKFLSPRVTCWIWRLVCLKLLVTLFWVQPVRIAILPAIATPTRPAEIASEGPVPHYGPVASLSESALPAQPVAPMTRQIAGAQSTVPIGAILMLLWLTCVVCFVIVTIRTWISVHKLCRTAATVNNDSLQRACRLEAERLAIRRLPKIRLSPRVESPLLVGICRPTIVLPDRAEMSFDEPELRLMLGHELAHQKRRDLIWNWLPTVVGWLFFFHPLVWLMKRCWLEAQEAACDELLIQNQIARPAEYGRLLLKLATRRLAESRAGLAAAGVLGSYRNLERRILAMTRVKPRSSRRLLAIATALSLVVLLGIIPWTLVAEEPTVEKRAPGHDDQPKTQSDGHGVWLGDQTKSSPPTIIIAEHALLWDNQIVTWEQVLNGFRAMRLSGPFRARFAFTNAVARRKNEGWRYWNDRIMAVYPDLFSPIGVTVGSLSPRGSEKFDAVRTTEDLRPDSARARAGEVLMPDGKPAAGAQVVVLPVADSLTVMLSGAQLRDSLDEQWTLTDATGRYTVYPQKDDCWIAALHPEGFALRRGAAKDEHRTVRLQPWATVTFSSTGESAGQTADINANPTGTGPKGPYFDVYQIKTKGKPIDVNVPAGKMVVSRSLETKEGVAIAAPVEAFSLAPGEQRTLAVAPANAADRAAASDKFERLHGTKKTEAKPAPMTKTAPDDRAAKVDSVNTDDSARRKPLDVAKVRQPDRDAAAVLLKYEAELTLNSEGAITRVAVEVDPRSNGLGGPNLDDEGLSYVGRLLDLERLYLGNTHITDAGLSHLNGLSHLKILVLENTQITDAGLKHLATLTNLRRLYLDNNIVRDGQPVRTVRITDEGVGSLKPLTKLEDLVLDRTAISDRGLERLQDMKSLRNLYLFGTSVTDEGVAKFKRALPDCQVAREAPPAATEPKSRADQKPPDAPLENARALQLKHERNAAPIWAVMGKEHGYKLDEGQNLRRFAPPFPAARSDWYNAINPSSEKVVPADASTFVFRLSGGQVANWTLGFGEPDKPGRNILGLLDWLARITPPMVEGPDDLLRQRVPGDWIVREGVSDEQIVKEFNGILSNELSLPIRLNFRKVDRAVYVADGVYRHKPAPGGRDIQTFLGADGNFRADVVEIFSKQLLPDSDGRVGTFSEFLSRLGAFIGTPIVSEVNEPPRGKLSSYTHTRSPFTREMQAEDHDPSLVLANITAQSGLSFRKEIRRVRILFATSSR